MKDEYKNLKGNEIAQLRKDGKQVTEETVEPTIVFTGDTTIQLLLEEPQLLKFPVIVTGNSIFNVTVK